MLHSSESIQLITKRCIDSKSFLSRKNMAQANNRKIFYRRHIQPNRKFSVYKRYIEVSSIALFRRSHMRQYRIKPPKRNKILRWHRRFEEAGTLQD